MLCDRPRHHRAAQAVSDRRADQGARARHHRQHHRRVPRAEENARHHHPGGRAEFPVRQIARRFRRGHGQRPHRSCRRHGRTRRRPRPAARAPRPAPGSAPMKAGGAKLLPLRQRDIVPVLLVPVVALAALPLVGSFSTWVTLTSAGLAMGMIIFIIASGLTLVFGLMDVLNFGHGAFISIGAYAAAALAPSLAVLMQADSLPLNLIALAVLILARHGGDRRARLRLRARHHHAGLRPASETDPGHRRRADRRRAAHRRGVRPGADRAAVADRVPRRAGVRRHRRRALPADRGRRRPRLSSPPCCWCSTAPASAC